MTVAMVLAAGFGKRLGELGTKTAKAVVTVNDEPVISNLLTRLQQANISRCVINLHHLGQQIQDIVGDGSKFNLEVIYSHEQQILDVAGGIANAIDLFDNKPFIVTNCDIVAEYDFSNLVELAPTLENRLGHLVLGNSPAYKPQGDFCLVDKLIQPLDNKLKGYSFIGTALYQPAMFAHLTKGVPARIQPLWTQAINDGLLSGEIYSGKWIDVGTPERLQLANTS